MTSEKLTIHAVGIMCGTSLDGIDVALVEAPGFEQIAELSLRAHLVFPFAELDAARLRDLASGASTTAEELSDLRFRLARDEAAAVRELLASETPLQSEELHYVAAHGITICHRPGESRGHGWQLHAGAALAAGLGCPVVDEFRAADIALGGQGAPLAPIVDFALRRSADEDRAILNLGGVANLTLLPAGCARIGEVICGDVGPANLPLDAIVRAHLERDYDEDGALASRGTANNDVVEKCLEAPWVRAALPRSFGREEFGASWVRDIETAMPRAEVADLLATVIEVEVRALEIFLREFAAFRNPDDRQWRCYVTGGGRHNQAWLARAREVLDPIEFMGIEELGVDPDAKEAVDFAFLGGQTCRRRMAMQSELTGAAHDLVLGSLHDPWGRA
jgi:anhydro-N-acetylmuramic acid kinase